MMQDYGKNIPSDSIAREMLRIRIQPKLVEQYTGLPQESVSRIKRSLLRTLSSVQTHPGLELFADNLPKSAYTL